MAGPGNPTLTGTEAAFLDAAEQAEAVRTACCRGPGEGPGPADPPTAWPARRGGGVAGRRCWSLAASPYVRPIAPTPTRWRRWPPGPPPSPPRRCPGAGDRRHRPGGAARGGRRPAGRLAGDPGEPAGGAPAAPTAGPLRRLRRRPGHGSGRQPRRGVLGRLRPSRRAAAVRHHDVGDPRRGPAHRRQHPAPVDVPAGVQSRRLAPGRRTCRRDARPGAAAGRPEARAGPRSARGDPLGTLRVVDVGFSANGRAFAATIQRMRDRTATGGRRGPTSSCGSCATRRRRLCCRCGSSCPRTACSGGAGWPSARTAGRRTRACRCRRTTWSAVAGSTPARVTWAAWVSGTTPPTSSSSTRPARSWPSPNPPIGCCCSTPGRAGYVGSCTATPTRCGPFASPTTGRRWRRRPGTGPASSGTSRPGHPASDCGSARARSAWRSAPTTPCCTAPARTGRSVPGTCGARASS